VFYLKTGSGVSLGPLNLLKQIFLCSFFSLSWDVLLLENRQWCLIGSIKPSQAKISMQFFRHVMGRDLFGNWAIDTSGSFEPD
jgi:hypothetical protein